MGALRSKEISQRPGLSAVNSKDRKLPELQIFWISADVRVDGYRRRAIQVRSFERRPDILQRDQRANVGRHRQNKRASDGAES
jgi:hypothetical protein